MFSSHQKGTFAIKFKSGTQVSVVWKPGTYSDNHDVFDHGPGGGMISQAQLMGADRAPCVSSTAEVMVTDDPTGKAVPYVEQQHGDNPAGYLNVEQVMDILNFARNINA